MTGASRPGFDAMAIASLATPAFLIDRDRLERNCDTMRAKAALSGVRFRPHVKTHKTVEIARMQHGGERGPVTVSTLAEAEFLAAAGFDDITYAVPLAPEKLQRAHALSRNVGRLNLLIDSEVALREIERFSSATGATFDIFLKVDCGYHRAGIDPDRIESVQLAKAMAESPAIRLRGLLTHAGHSYHATGRAELLAIAAQESAAVAKFAMTLAVEGISGLVRSVGSTPTASVVARFEDCDEVRPGNYVFFDAFQRTIGACSADEVAVSVLTTVIGSYPERREAIIDAGALALSKDGGASHVDPGCGYGAVCNLQLAPLDLQLVALSQEHGKLVCRGATPEVGTKLRIVPNHSCLTAAMFDRYDVISEGQVIDAWHPVRGW